MKKYLIILIFIFQGCDLLENKPDQVIARLNDEFLYNSDLVEKLPKNLSKDDSILFAKILLIIGQKINFYTIKL